jgi:hypothetical protein
LPAPLHGRRNAALYNAALSALAVELLKSKQPDYLTLTSPELWQVVFDREPAVALEKLAAMMTRKDFSLATKEEANALLERLTGKSVSWTATARPAARAEPARRWLAIVSSRTAAR